MCPTRSQTSDFELNFKLNHVVRCFHACVHKVHLRIDNDGNIRGKLNLGKVERNNMES